MLITGVAPPTLTEIYNLSGNALLEFGSGAITSIANGAQLNELGNSRVALTGNTATNSALATLSSTAKSVTVQNAASVTALNDVLVGSIGAGGAPFSGSGTLGAGLGPQAASSALQVNLNTGKAGQFSGTANLALASHDADLADLALSTNPLSLQAQVNLYAALAFTKQGGQGSLTGGGSAFDLDFGNVAQGNGQDASLAMLNDNPLVDQLFTDLLSSTGTTSSGSGFSFTGCSVNDLAGGVNQGGCDISFDTTSVGSFIELLSFDVESSNGSGYDQVIGDVTLTLEGSVGSSPPSVPEPNTMTMLVSGFSALFFMVRRRRGQ